MIDLYTHTTPNGYKITIALEELGLPYEPHTVNIREGAQFEPEITTKNPNAKIPIIHDRDTGVTVYESSAILLYLAEKAGKLFPPRDESSAYWDGIQKLTFAAASIGPMFGQRMHFSYLAPETVPYGIERYENEGTRLRSVLDAMLEGQDWLLAWGYSVVDIAVFGWVMLADKIGYVDADAHPNLRAWIDRMNARPAVRKGLTVPDKVDPSRLPPHKLAQAS